MNDVKVSIIISLYNKEAYIKETVESVLNQTYRGFELIIVDDGSTDQGLAICEELCRDDDRVKIYHIENHGMSYARKYGLDRATGEWISILDADDVLDERFLEALLQVENENSDIITAKIGMLGGKSIDETKEVISLSNEEALKYTYLPLRGDGSYFHLIQGKIIRRRLFDIFFEKYKEEIEKLPYNFFDDVFIVPHIIYEAKAALAITKVLYYYRVVADSSCHTMVYKAFHYEQVDAVFKVLELYERERLASILNIAILNSLLVAHKAWYAAEIAPTKSEDIEKLQREIVEKTDFYYAEVKKNKTGSRMKKMIIQLFRNHRRVWKVFMDVYFGKLYLYLNK